MLLIRIIHWLPAKLGQATRVSVAACSCILLASCMPTNRVERSQFIEQPKMTRTLSQSGLPVVEGEKAWPREEWWRAFRSAELDAIIDKALADNQNYRKAQDALREADAAIRISGARLLPEINSLFGTRQSRIPQNGVVASYNPEQGGLEKTMAFLNPLALTWELDFWHKNRALLDAAIGEAAAQAGETEQSRLLLTTGVARAYLRGYALTQQLGLASTLVRMRRELRALADTRYRTGLDTLDGVQIARTNEEAAVRREATVRAAITLQRDALARLMGEGPDAGLAVFKGGGNIAPAQPALPKSLPIELLRRRPDLAASLARAEAWAARIHAAKTLFLPSIDLALGGGFEASVTSTKISKLSGYLFNPSALGYVAASSIRLPVFQGGRLSGNLEIQRAEYDQAVDAYNDTLLQAAQQVADAIANLRRARSEFDSQSRFVQARRTELALSKVRLRDGLRDRREILQESADLLDAIFSLRGLEGDRLIAAVDLYQALGGGFANGPAPDYPKPAPETDPITPVVEGIQSLTGG
ncbi:efflux transporter outer membrane subunit [Methylocystis sp. WRRC1]|uniref:efflux transporter outer membrane subunit n=1 Tax=Methylocystis sp. WRRC1 TaxID=1732014 RepID=UPI001D154D7C|nr:efflux transporter outer membrane subunit [Methylocystis sp. WRRC1]MCC3245394.1 efflux transporter outer membrane subunit [Methylocystis sp. WRRC1]